jgi:uncharacterized protein (AIM24 family)
VRFDELGALVPSGDPFVTKPALRRVRGQQSDEAIGAHAVPVLTVQGNGHAIVTPIVGRLLHAVSLTDDHLYLREDRTVAFASTLNYENGRMKAADEAVPLIQLTGSGPVMFDSRAPVRCLIVSAERSVVVRADLVVGWVGRLLSQPVPSEHAPHHTHGFVSLAGDGKVILEAEAPLR